MPNVPTEWQVPDRSASESDKIGWLNEGLCECGCGQKTEIATRNQKEKGWIKGKPKRFVHGHNPIKAELRKIEEFWSKWVFSSSRLDTPCWQWTGAANANGYATSGAIRGERQANRISYMLTREEVIPRDYEIDHLCFNRLCINPLHLECVTPTVNVRRSSITRANEEMVALIRNSDLTDRAMADLLGIHHSTVSAIRTRKTWKDV